MTERTDEQVPMFNMKAVTRETGLNPMTIRSWERRYGLPSPQRSEGRHRLYSQRDIDTLKWLVARQDEGLAISHAANMWTTLEAQGTDPLQQSTHSNSTSDSAATRQNVVIGAEMNTLRASWVDACLRFDREGADRALAQAFSLFPAEMVCLDLLQKGLVEIGEGWVQGTVTVQQEHFASALALGRLETLIASASRPIRPEKIITACAPDDNHTFGLLLFTLMLLRKGWDVIYLGASVPVAELVKTVAQVEPRLVVMSAQRFYTASTLLDVANVVHAHGVPFAFGGGIFNQMPGLHKLVTGHFLGRSLDESLDKVHSLLTKQKVAASPIAVSQADKQALDDYNKCRTHIESDIWDAFVGRGRPTEHLTTLNRDMAQLITAALKFGNFKSLGIDRSWIEYQLIAYRLSSEELQDYLYEYYRAAKIYLSNSSQIVSDWLGQIIAS
ncbi:MerR family transcriptional regulator [Chloroflexi bacterium TSY]|nr:MerR family transcriptional regulator [Chloroflexi bacterium TSY]